MVAFRESNLDLANVTNLYAADNTDSVTKSEQKGLARRNPMLERAIVQRRNSVERHLHGIPFPA